MQSAHSAKSYGACCALPQLAYLGSPEFEVEIRAEAADKKLDRIDWIGEDGNSGVLAALNRDRSKRRTPSRSGTLQNAGSGYDNKVQIHKGLFICGIDLLQVKRHE